MRVSSLDLSTEIADVHKISLKKICLAKVGKKFSLLLSYFFKFKIVVVGKGSTFLLISHKNIYKTTSYSSSTLVCDCALVMYPE